jgi:hypothetical protein
MDVCPSCGEVLELVEDVGLRAGSADESGAVPGGERPPRPAAKMVCSVCSWPVDDARP